LVGHSERRELHNESDATVRAKMMAAHAASVKTILCVGEKDPKMEEGARKEFVRNQLLQSLAPSANATNTVIAYEPVWAIGSGVTPTTKQIVHMHEALHSNLPFPMRGCRVIYGGSVNVVNAEEILSLKGVDGVLPGGASLKADTFIKIIEAAVG
jgi:triosephosphate isomerase